MLPSGTVRKDHNERLKQIYFSTQSKRNKDFCLIPHRKELVRCHLTAFYAAIYIEFWYLYFCRYQNICLYSGDFVFYTVSGTVVNPDPKVRSSKRYTMRHCAVLTNMTSISGFATGMWPCIQKT